MSCPKLSPRMTPEQMAALRYLIACAKEPTLFVKKLILLLLDSTDGLTTMVALHVPAGILPSEGNWRSLDAEVVHTVSHLNSVSDVTHLYAVLAAMGTSAMIVANQGCEISVGAVDGATVWIAPIGKTSRLSREGEYVIVPFDRELIEAIALPKSALLTPTAA